MGRTGRRARAMLRAVGLTGRGHGQALRRGCQPGQRRHTRATFIWTGWPTKVKAGHSERQQRPFPFRHHNRQRRHFDGDGGHEGVPGQPGGHCRLDRDGLRSAESMDGLAVVAACDKNMPGALMAMARLNIPSLFVYGGAIPRRPVSGGGTSTSRICTKPSAPTHRASSPWMSLQAMERVACPGEGACAGMFTANTMASAIEALWGCLCRAPPRYPRCGSRVARR